MVRDIRRSIVSLLVLTVLLAASSRSRSGRSRQVAFKRPGRRLADRPRRHRRRLEPARPGLRQRRGTSSRGRRRSTTTRAARRPRTSARTRPTWPAAVRTASPPSRRPNGIAAGAVPVDLVTASALRRRPRHLARTVRWCRSTAWRKGARARSAPRSGRWCSTACSRRPSGCSGTTRVNVLELNLALDGSSLDGRPARLGRGAHSPDEHRRLLSLARVLRAAPVVCVRRRCCRSGRTRTSARSR